MRSFHLKPTSLDSPEEYLALEEAADYKSEYIDGSSVLGDGVRVRSHLFFWNKTNNARPGSTATLYLNWKT